MRLWSFWYSSLLRKQIQKIQNIKENLLFKRDQPQLNKAFKSFPLKLFDWNIYWYIFTISSHVVMKLVKGVL